MLWAFRALRQLSVDQFVLSNKSYFPFAFNLVSASIITTLYHASLNALPQERQNQNPYVNN